MSMHVMCEQDTGESKFLCSWGANSHGQLCLGTREDKSVPSHCHIPEGIDSLEHIRRITGGAGHTVIVAGNGWIFATGWNHDGQLGLGYSGRDDVLVPRHVPSLMDVKRVSCGWNHTLAIAGCGNVFAWGCNSYGQLGLDISVKQCSRPTNVAGIPACGMVSLAAGVRHSLAVARDGKVWAWGDNKRQQLGIDTGGENKWSTPTQVTVLSEICCTQVSAGFHHSVALSVDGQVLTWGCNRRGQCGAHLETASVDAMSEQEAKPCNADASNVVTKESKPSGHFEKFQSFVAKPTVVDFILEKLRVAEVHCGWSHTLAITDDRRVFTWGRADYGQLGVKFEDLPSSVSRPTEVQCLKGVQKVCCGSEHNLAITGDGHLVAWGWNEHGMCGTGDETNHMLPTPVCLASRKDGARHMHKVLDIGCGSGHSVAVVSTSSVYNVT